MLGLQRMPSTRAARLMAGLHEGLEHQARRQADVMTARYQQLPRHADCSKDSAIASGPVRAAASMPNLFATTRWPCRASNPEMGGLESSCAAPGIW